MRYLFDCRPRLWLALVVAACWVPFYALASALTGNWWYLWFSAPLTWMGTMGIFWRRFGWGGDTAGSP